MVLKNPLQPISNFPAEIEKAFCFLHWTAAGKSFSKAQLNEYGFRMHKKLHLPKNLGAFREEQHNCKFFACLHKLLSDPGYYFFLFTKTRTI